MKTRTGKPKYKPGPIKSLESYIRLMAISGRQMTKVDYHNLLSYLDEIEEQFSDSERLKEINRELLKAAKLVLKVRSPFYSGAVPEEEADTMLELAISIAEVDK